MFASWFNKSRQAHLSLDQAVVDHKIASDLALERALKSVDEAKFLAARAQQAADRGLTELIGYMSHREKQ